MRALIHLDSKAVIPADHGYELQSILYYRLTGDSRKLIGDEGKPRLLSLSSINGGRPARERGCVKFNGPCSFMVATPHDASMIARRLGPDFPLFDQGFRVTGFQEIPEPKPAAWWQVMEQSPLLCHGDQPVKADSRAKKWVVASEHPDICSESLKRNLLTRWASLLAIPEMLPTLREWLDGDAPTMAWAEANAPEISLDPATSSVVLRTLKHKHSRVPAWIGDLNLAGHKAWARVIWHTGLGAKSMFGFGLVQPLFSVSR